MLKPSGGLLKKVFNPKSVAGQATKSASSSKPGGSVSGGSNIFSGGRKMRMKSSSPLAMARSRGGNY